jgi:hypothetical protein
MAFTADELAYLQTRLGSSVDEDLNPTLVEDLETRYDRLGTAPLVAVEVLRIRLATIADPLNNPLNFTVPGEWSQDSTANVAFLREMLRLAEQDAGVPGSSVVTGISPPDDRWRRNCVGSVHPEAGRYTYWPYGR